MRFLADENVPGPVVAALRRGSDVMWIRESMPGADHVAIVTALTSRDDWTGNFAVIERDRITEAIAAVG